MRSSSILCMALATLAACGSAPIAHVKVPPTLPPVFHGSQKERMGDPSAPVDEEASLRWLDEEIARKQSEPPIKEPPPPPETQVVYVERGDGYYDPCYPRHRDVGNPILSSLAGAGIGAIIGHQSGHKQEGAWIGAGAGLLLDALIW